MTQTPTTQTAIQTPTRAAMPHRRRDPRVDAQRFAYVLQGLPFPAAKWQVISHAEHYGADAVTKTALWTLPVGVYPNLTALLHALGISLLPPAGA